MEGDANVAAWLDAIRTRSYASARQCLARSDLDVNVRGLGGTTALHVAARYNSLKKIEKLILDGADLNITDDQGQTPLRVTQRHNKRSAVRYLIHHEELMRALAGRLGRTPVLVDVVAAMQHKKMRAFRKQVQLRVDASSEKLVAAARAGGLETVKAMVEGKEIPIDAMHPITDETAFSAALTAGHRRVCEYLLDNGAHVFAWCIVNGKRQSTVVAAVINGDVDFVRHIVACGAELSLPQLDTMTSPLAEAVKLGPFKMIDTLLSLGARAAFNRHGVCPPCPAEYAFRYGATTMNTDDATAFWLLTIACWLQDMRIINHLFKTQAAIQKREMMASNGARALFLAVYQQNEQIVTELLERGADINASIPGNLPAIVAAVAVNSTKLMHFLISRGAAMSGVDQGLLATAIRAGATDCALALLSLERRSSNLDSAFNAAAVRSDVMITRLLFDIALPSTAEVLRWCLLETHCPLLVELLLSRCASERFTTQVLHETFAHQCHFKDVAIVAVYLAHGADVDADGCRGQTPLLAALQNLESGVEIAKLLLRHGAAVVTHDRVPSEQPLAQVENWLRFVCPEQKEHFEAVRDFLITHGAQ